MLGDAGAAHAFLCLHEALAGPVASGWSEVAEQELLVLLAGLSGHTAPSASPERLPSVRRARDRIDTAPDQPAALADLADDAGLSPYHFLRVFKARTGLPPHAYRLQRQLQRARRSLLAGQSIALAALDAGFADQSHLTRHFVRAYGLTPGALARAVG